MKLQSLILRNSLFLLTLTLALPAFRAAAQSKPDSATAAQTAAIPARITEAIDETQLVRLQGNVHPLARPEFDQGIVADATPMKRMMLVLQRSPEQQAALTKFMDEQLSKDSPNFHQWLTPEQFGKQFGPADADIQAVTDWLTRQGFQGIKVGAGRTAIEFSGNVAQVRNAFHTEIHKYIVNGESRQANSSDPQIAAALTSVVAGVLSLHNFPRKSFRHDAGIHIATREVPGKPQFTTTSGCGTTGTQPCYVVGPADFAKIYNIPASLDGTLQHIAIVADSNINPQDVTDFRNLFSLPTNPPNIILNGPDPGLNGDEVEADLDVQVSGMVAPKATIDLVVSEDTLTALGIDLSAFYIIDNNIAPVMSESFGDCEANLVNGGNTFFNNLWEQAAAEGITVMIAAGDPGSAGCDNFNTESAATLGLAVSGFASTLFNVAVGGTDFDDFTTQTTFWSPTNSVDGKRESALGYIHEIPWNDSCAATATATTLNTVCATANNIVGGGGGPSSIYAKPAWQSGIIPNGIAAGDNHRYTPDVSLFASDGPQSMSFYLVCQADAVPAGNPPSCASSGSFSFGAAGGTSASSPALAAIIALINQSQVSAGQVGRQGNPNPVLYKIAATAGQSCNSSSTPLTGSTTCSFYDVTKGNNSVPCVGNSPNCSSKVASTNGVLVSPASATTPAWTTATGYDLATGLGSVNVANLATQWPLAVGKFTATTTSLMVNGGTSTVTITHGTAVTAKVTVAPSSGTGTPTGDVGLLAPTRVNGGIGDATLPGGTGTVTISGVILPGGGYNVNARYAGDTTFASSTSSPGVPVVVSKESSGLQIGIVTLNGNAITSTNATSFAYGSPYILRFDILNHTGNSTNCQPLANVTTPPTSGCAFDATGTVTITDNGAPLDTGTFIINSAGSAEDQPIQLTGGTHALSATYSGDISYNPVTVAVVDNVAVTQAATATVLTPGATTVQTNQGITLSVAISTQSNSTAGPTGNVTFKDGTTTIGTATATPAGATATAGASATAVLNASFTTTGTHSLTAVYAGDTNYASSTSAGVTLTVGVLTTTAVTSSSTSIASGGSVTLTAKVSTTSNGGGPTGTVQFTNGTTNLSTAVICTPTAGTSTATAFCTATLTTTLAFLAPPSVPNHIPSIRFQPIMYVAFVLLILFLIGLKRIPSAYRRLYASAGLLLLVGIVAGFAGCGGYGGGGGGGVHYDSITAVYSGDATYSGSTSPAITITVQ